MDDLDVLFPALAGSLMSLLFAYLPGLADWYARLDGTRKRLVMLAGMVVVALGYAGLGCAPFGELFGVPATVCSDLGLATIARAFVAALVANQSTYLVSPRV